MDHIHIVRQRYPNNFIDLEVSLNGGILAPGSNGIRFIGLLKQLLLEPPINP